ncbi:helix-turn-helix domain-containing protein [Micrococcales bacterium 31B]|nr:helix-turn-helix domain-containing protein [Micrococcales bacterium 31B]
MTQAGSHLFERTVALLAHAPVETRAHLLRALHLVADSLGHGDAVTLSRHEATVTTQEAADVLGISRPTLVRLLEQGAIPFSQPSRHRRILLADVLAYQASHDGIHQGSAPETNEGGPGFAAPSQA